MLMVELILYTPVLTRIVPPYRHIIEPSFGGFLLKIVFMRLIALLKHSASFVPSHLKSQKPCVLVVPITTVADCAPVIKHISDAIATQ